MEEIKHGALTLELREGEYTVTGCDKDVTEVIVPVRVEGIPVVEIGENAFDGCGALRRVIFEEPTDDEIIEGAELKEIGEYAFNYCVSLKEIELPFTVWTIRRGAFYGCTALKKVTFSRIASVGAYAFCRCKSLVEVTPISGYISEGAFSMCESLERLPICDGTRVIEEDAFEHCYALKRVIIPKSVERIESLAFRSCRGLKSVSFQRVDGWWSRNRYRENDVKIDVSSPTKNAESLSRMDFDDGVSAWYIKK